MVFCIELYENSILDMNVNFNQKYYKDSIEYSSDMQYEICYELVEYIYINFLNRLDRMHDQELQENYSDLEIKLEIYPDIEYSENSTWYLYLVVVPDFPNLNSLIYLGRLFNSDIGLNKQIIQEFIDFLKTILPKLLNPVIKYGTTWHYN